MSGDKNPAKISATYLETVPKELQNEFLKKRKSIPFEPYNEGVYSIFLQTGDYVKNLEYFISFENNSGNHCIFSFYFESNDTVKMAYQKLIMTRNQFERDNSWIINNSKYSAFFSNDNLVGAFVQTWYNKKYRISILRVV